MSLQNYHKFDDNELLAAYYASQENDLLGTLLQRYTMLLYGVGMKYLKDEDNAKDAVQQVFLKVIHELPKTKVTYFKSWLYMVAKNHCLMQLRSKGHLVSSLDENIAAAAEETDKNVFLEKDAQLDQMALALNELNPAQKQCITLFYLEKKSYQEIADYTNYAVLHVKSHIQNGKRNLKIIMERLQQS